MSTHRGTVATWHVEEGWGLLTCPDLDGPVWAHFSAVEPDRPGGFRALTEGAAVTAEVERADQDGCRWRAVHVRSDRT